MNKLIKEIRILLGLKFLEYSIHLVFSYLSNEDKIKYEKVLEIYKKI